MLKYPMMTLLTLKSKKNFIIKIIGFFGACWAMWFGVFILHLYGATGTKKTTGAFVLALDWLLIAVYGMTIFYITCSKQNAQQYKTMPFLVKASGYLVDAFVVFGILALVIVGVFYVLLTLNFGHWIPGS